MRNTFCTIDLTFTIVDRARCADVCAKMIAQSKDKAQETNCLYYGFCSGLGVNDNKATSLVVRSAHLDAKGVNTQLMDHFGDEYLLREEVHAFKLKSLIIHGPEDQIEEIKPFADPLGAKYFVTLDGGFTNLDSSLCDGDDQSDTLVTVYGLITALDWDKFDHAPFVEATAMEEGVAFYGFACDKENNQVLVREAYRDGDAFNVHADNVNLLWGKLLEEGVVQLDSFRMQGPAAECAKTKQATELLGADIMPMTGSSFARYTII